MEKLIKTLLIDEQIALGNLDLICKANSRNAKISINLRKGNKAKMIDSLQISYSPFSTIDAYLLKEHNDWDKWHDGEFETLFNYIKQNEELDYSLLTTDKEGHKRGYEKAYNAYKYYGVQFQAIDYTREIICTIYPHQVTYPHDKVTVYTPSEQDLFLKGINTIFDEINAPHIESSLWQVKRIDYTVNIPCAFTRLYLDLFNRSRSMHYQDRKQFDGNSCYLKGKGITYNIYSKQNQLEKKTNRQKIDRNITQDDIENATDILRIEVQCKSEKVKTIQKKHRWKDRNIMHYLDPSIAVEVLRGCAKQFYVGDYWSADKGKSYNVFAKIDQASGIQQTTKDNMKEVLSLLANNRELTLDEVRQTLTESKKLTDTQWYTIIKRFNAININPVPIPTRQCKEYHIRQLDSLTSLLNDYIDYTGLEAAV